MTWIIHQIAGGGGAGGRMAVYASDSNTYRGEYRTNGGEGYVEFGGSGTTFIKAPNSDGVEEVSLYVDNKGAKPKTEAIKDKTKDTARTYIVTSEDDTSAAMTFDHVYIDGNGHLALLNTTTTDTEITIKLLHGDNSGMIHSSVDQRFNIENSDRPFPAAIKLYDESYMKLPLGEYYMSIILSHKLILY